MKTFIQKKETIERKWFVVDAKDKVLGQIATRVADKLRGKDKPIFSPHMDCGDFVIIINADKFKLTGKKMEDKMYQSHSGFPGGFREINAKNLLIKKPTKALEVAISGMLPKNRLRSVFLDKLKLYAEDTHPHEAQSPEKLEV